MRPPSSRHSGGAASGMRSIRSAAFEPSRVPLVGLALPEIGRLPADAVDGLLGAANNVVLLDDMSDDGTVFGAGAGLARSAALARLRPGRTPPPGPLALGSREPTTFHPGQGSDLLEFLARVVEPCVHNWLREAA